MRRWLLLLWCLAALEVLALEPGKIMSAADLAGFPQPAPTARIAYGNQALQFGDLRIPDGPGPHPLAIFIHGGCWLSAYDISHSAKLTQALADSGIAVWSVEYRRVGDPGGGWPGSFRDVGKAADHLRELATQYPLALDRVVAIGHSAGAHFALWLAVRDQIPPEHALAAPEPLPIAAVLGLAPAADLGFLHQQQVCGQVIDGLIGGSPDRYPERYRWADPARFALPGLMQVMVIGAHDRAWAPVGERYLAVAQARNDQVRRVDAPESGHFEMIDPDSSTWPLIRDWVHQLVSVGGGQLPAADKQSDE